MSYYEKNITQANMVDRSKIPEDPDAIEPCPKEGPPQIQVTNGMTACDRSLTPSVSIDTTGPTHAVEARGVTFTHGRGKKAVHALRGIDLTVPEGQIYGLLGPSGCGKTTLIRTIIGRAKPHSGTVKVFGHTPGTPESYVPGPVIGYMPQEIALFNDFTIRETMYYFGRLYRIKRGIVKERMSFLLKFLDLPDKWRLVRNLSGGQKRRVSLATSLIHSPPLLILDEPTVGVDPVLRQTIWDHLVHLSKTEGLSVIITTHYIEEARAAHVVGLTRYGRILMEQSPESLLKQFNMPTLEDVFLKLCQTDAAVPAPEQSTVGSTAALCPPGHVGSPTTPAAQSLDLQSVDTGFGTEEKRPDVCKVTPTSMDSVSKETPARQAKEQYEKAKSILASFSPRKTQKIHETYDTKLIQPKLLNQNSISSSIVKKVEPGNEFQRTYSRISALFEKNIINTRRNLALLLFNFLLPSIEIILFAVSIGQDPFNLPFAVYNGDPRGPFSRGFLNHLDNRTIIQQRYNNSMDAIQAVKAGECWGALFIKQNFSKALQTRLFSGPDVSEATINASQIDLHLDMSNYLIGLKLQRTLLENFQSYGQKMLNMMGMNPALAELPIIVQEPIYGVREPTFTEFMAPGVVLSIGFLSAVALTALTLITERKEGLLDRSLVAGVKPWEFLLSHLMTQFFVMIVQVLLLLVFTFGVFQIPIYGPYGWVAILLLLQAFCGMSFGLLISAITNEETEATMLALGSFYPNLLLSGTVWPTQGMPTGLRYFSYILPQTLPIESMRYMVSRGWGFTHGPVLIGFGVSIAWTAVFLILAIVIFRLRI